MTRLVDAARARVEKIDFQRLKRLGIERTLENYYILGTYPPLTALEDVKTNRIDVFKGNEQTEFDIYVHFPFCESKCEYCHFYSIIINEAAIERYLGNLKREITAIKKRIGAVRTRSVYIGGGTPSLMKPAQLTGLIRHLKTILRFQPAPRFPWTYTPP